MAQGHGAGQMYRSKIGVFYLPLVYLAFWSSPEADSQHWTQQDSPMLSNGGKLNFDAVHHLLYSSNRGVLARRHRVTL